MTKSITSDVVEAYSLCPRKAFLLMAATGANPGPHDYELVVRDQAEANRHAHRVRLSETGEVVPFGGLDDLAAGRDVLADVELTADGLHARCDFLTKVSEPSRLGRFSYEPVKVIGTCRASRQDILGLAYQGLVLGEVQGRQPPLGTLVLLGGRPCKVKLAGRYKEVRRIVEVLRGWMCNAKKQRGHSLFSGQTERPFSWQAAAFSEYREHGHRWQCHPACNTVPNGDKFELS